MRKRKGFPLTMALRSLYKAESERFSVNHGIKKPVQIGNGVFGVFRSKEYAETFDARGTASSVSISPSETLVSRAALVGILPGHGSAYDCERKCFLRY